MHLDPGVDTWVVCPRTASASADQACKQNITQYHTLLHTISHNITHYYTQYQTISHLDPGVDTRVVCPRTASASTDKAFTHNITQYHILLHTISDNITS